MEPNGGHATHRLALLVGIRDYDHLDSLVTPYQDVRALARVLKAMDFDVHTIADGAAPRTSEAIRSKLIEIRPALAAISEAGQDGACVLFYFAGHGILHLDHIYLLDERARANEAAIRSHSLSLDELLDDLAPARGVPKVVLLDCCQSSMQAGGGGLRLPRELPHQTLIGFSTSPGHVAMDGRAHGLSPYAAALYRHLPTPGVSLGDVMTRVAGSVRESSGKVQNAVHLTTLCDPLVLAVPEAPMSAPAHRAARSCAGSADPAPDEPPIVDLGDVLHRLRVCKFRDDSGRSAWYVLLLNEGGERNFVDAAAGDGRIDLTAYGRVLAREYGEQLSEAICDHVGRRFGPRIADRVRAIRARVRPAGHGSSGHGAPHLPPNS